ncbi:agmatine coumaroyltransferase-2-like [Andrographis paniculata]|uniref:agmatine coumaroyltransferase-2-like n=1 Tax=Andrographis paniculata TaxID=175694 RepID=UPI0021E94A7A|nr:agmatine coumaroyltransferase-2-like [Andrographis paniculata]
MKLKISSSKIVKPIYESNSNVLNNSPNFIHLSVFDRVTYDQHVAVIYAYRPPTPSNAAVELGLRRALGVYRAWAGRLGTDPATGNPIILLNDAGVRFVEASFDHALDEQSMLKPSRSSLTLHPAFDGVVELVQVQLTRFACGSLVVGFTSHHLVADGHATSDFLVAWGRACRGLEIVPRPFCDRAVFSPRDPPVFEYEHRGVEFISKNFKKAYPLIDNSVENIVVHRVHYTVDFLSRLKAKASSNKASYTTFESLVGHLWRAITIARGLNGHETTQVRMSVDGRSRIKPKLPDEYFGNLVLWAFARSKVEVLVENPLSYAARLLHEAIVNVGDDYFKSFIDFASHKAKEEDLIPNAVADTHESILWPDLEVDSWLRFPFYDLDFGSGSPHIFVPSFSPTEGMIFLLPSFAKDRSIDVFVPLFRDNVAKFEEICYSLD